MLTRDDVAPYVPALAALGLEAIAMPVTRAAPALDPAALAGAVAGDYAAIVVTSARAAEALARAGAPRGEIWAVGPATLRALADAGIAATHPPGARDGQTLAIALVAHRALAGRRVLVPRSDIGRADAAAILRAAGAEVVEVVAYRTIADPGADLSPLAGAVVCVSFAPSQVAALAARVPLAELPLPFVAIGRTTAAALAEHGIAAAVADEPTPEGVARAVAAVYPPRS